MRSDARDQRLALAAKAAMRDAEHQKVMKKIRKSLDLSQKTLAAAQKEIIRTQPLNDFGPTSCG